MYRPLSRSVERAAGAESRAHPAQLDLADADQPAVHRGLHGGPQPRIRARAPVARVSRPTAAVRRSASSGTSAAFRRRAPTGRARAKTQGHPAAPRVDTARLLGENGNRWRRGRARGAGDPRRSCSSAIPTPSSTRRRTLEQGSAARERARALRRGRHQGAGQRRGPGIHYPLFIAPVDPDLTFIGFNATIETCAATSRSTRPRRRAPRSRPTSSAGSSCSRRPWRAWGSPPPSAPPAVESPPCTPRRRDRGFCVRPFPSNQAADAIVAVVSGVTIVAISRKAATAQPVPARANRRRSSSVSRRRRRAQLRLTTPTSLRLESAICGRYGTV